MKKFLPYLPWVAFVIVSIVAIFAIKSCGDRTEVANETGAKLDAVLADTARIDSVMDQRQRTSDSTLAYSQGIQRRAQDSLALARKLARAARAALDSNEAIASNDTANASNPEFWHDRYTDEKKATGKLLASNQKYEATIELKDVSYDSLSNVAYARAVDRDYWRGRAASLARAAANYREAVKDAQCVIKWPVRVCPSPTVTFVAGTVTGAGLAVLAH